MKKLRFGLVGCGRISKNHVEAMLQLSERCEIAAVCDTDEERANAAGQKTGAKPYTDIESLLAHERLDVISVATPSGLHPQHG